MTGARSLDGGDSGPAFPRRFLVLVALATAGLVGVADALIRLLLEGEHWHRPVRGDVRLVWMAPVAYAILLLVPTLLALALVSARGRGARRRLPIALTLILFPALFSLGLMVRVTHGTSIAVIALGVSIQIALLLGRKAERTERFMGRLALTVVLGLGLAAGTIEAGRFWKARRELAGLPAPPPGARNVIVLVWDTVRSLNLHLYGYSRPTTPNLDALARSGATFGMALAPAPWTVPSHGSFFSGYWEQEMIVGQTTPVLAPGPTLAGALAGLGFQTAGFAGNSVYAGREYGVARGFRHFEDYSVRWRTLVTSSEIGREIAADPRWIGRPRLWPPHRNHGAEVTSAFLRWLDRRAPDRPFFAFLNYIEAHHPRALAAPFDTAFGADPDRPEVAPHGWPPKHPDPAKMELEMRSYDAAILLLDHELGRLVAELTRRGLLDSTLVVVLGDHGEMLGEQSLYGHANTLRLELLRVPLVMRLPGTVPEGVTVSAPVTTRDLPATIWEAVACGAPLPFPGRSLARNLTAPADSGAADPIFAGETVFSGRHVNAIFAGGYAYAEWPGRDTVLFAFPADSLQLHDLAKDSNAPILAWMRERSDSLASVVAKARGGSSDDRE